MIEVRKRGRYFALYDGDVLLGLCVYKKGANSVKDRIDSLKQTIQAMKEAMDQREAACANR